MNKIFVVEGRNDVTRLKQVFPNLNVVSVNGSAINDDVLEMLIDKSKNHEIVLCMDPDYPGEKIRKTIASKISNVSHIFIEKSVAYSKNKKKIGFEHLSDEEIKKSLENIVKQNTQWESDLTMDFLYEKKLIGHINSRELRNKVSKKLKIGHVNGKTMLNRLKKFNISIKDLAKVLDEL
ncbi:MAG: ribonuclease M5 [Acholeplasma sp.]|nr:ribonuclease M5 [Acholeplasma sp.]